MKTTINNLEIRCLKSFDSALACLAARNGESAVSYALKAQMQVVKCFSDKEFSPATILTEMLSALGSALELAEGADERSMIQSTGALMLQSLVYFSNSLIEFKEYGWTQKGKDLLGHGVSAVNDSVTALANAAVGGGGVSLDMPGLLSDLSRPRGFAKKKLANVISMSAKQREIWAVNHQYELFIVAVFDELEKNASMFGRSARLSEMISKYTGMVCNIKKPRYPIDALPKAVYEYEGGRKDFSVARLVFSSIFTVAFTLILIWFINTDILWRLILLGSFTVNFFLMLGFGYPFFKFLIINVALLVSYPIRYLVCRPRYMRERAAYDAKCAKLEARYENLRDAFKIDISIT